MSRNFMAEYVCDVCGINILEMGPQAQPYTIKQAKREAIESGWHIGKKHTCPDCLDE